MTRHATSAHPSERIDARFPIKVETIAMLSPHELATLMLVRSAPDQIDMKRVELDTLLDCRLICLEPCVDGWCRPQLTLAGAYRLDAAARAKRKHDDGASAP